MKFKIEITEEQLQRVLNILGQAPYREIVDVIDSIQHQVNKQLTEK